jgi:hypothetical protein
LRTEPTFAVASTVGVVEADVNTGLALIPALVKLRVEVVLEDRLVAEIGRLANLFQQVQNV